MIVGIMIYTLMSTDEITLLTTIYIDDTMMCIVIIYSGPHWGINLVIRGWGFTTYGGGSVN